VGAIVNLPVDLIIDRFANQLLRPSPLVNSLPNSTGEEKTCTAPGKAGARAGHVVCGRQGIHGFVLALARYIPQVSFEGEATTFLGRGHCRRAERAHPGWRNGYAAKRLQTEAGLLELAVPQVRATPEPFRPTLVERMGVSPGKHRIKIELLGYQTFETEINLLAGQKSEVKTELMRGSIEQAGALVRQP
jgi:hypothetical protein